MENSESAFLPLLGYDGLYEVSRSGQIRSLDRLIVYANRKELRRGIILKAVVNNKNGYCYVNLYKNKKMKGHRLHRLVAETFIPNPNNLPQVNHKDFNKQNNTVENLEWCDSYYQQQHSAKKPNRKWQKHRLGKTGSVNPASKAVNVFDLNGVLLGKYESGRLAAQATKSEQTKVSACCLGKRSTHNNLKFQFA